MFGKTDDLQQNYYITMYYIYISYTKGPESLS